MGKGGGALSAWLKEFIALVFTQTLQAFIYAIIIVIIVYGLKPNPSVSGDDQNAALGLMATFALLSVFKVEDLAKKIFGIGDSKASHKNAMQSIAKTAIAAKLGGRVLNNAGKVLGGVKAINKAGQDRRKVKSRLQEDMADNGYKMENGVAKYVGKNKNSKNVISTSSNIGSNSGMSDAQKKYYEAAKEAKARGDMAEYERNRELAAAVRKGEKAIASSINNSSNNSDVISDAAKRRMTNALRNYEDRLSEINKARDEGIKSIASGLTESVTALAGGLTGGILGGSDGNIDEMLQGVLAGAGAGDVAGKHVIEGIDRATQFVKRNYNRKPGVSSKDLDASIKAYQDALEQANITYGITDVSDI